MITINDHLGDYIIVGSERIPSGRKLTLACRNCQSERMIFSSNLFKTNLACQVCTPKVDFRLSREDFALDKGVPTSVKYVLLELSGTSGRLYHEVPAILSPESKWYTVSGDKLTRVANVTDLVPAPSSNPEILGYRAMPCDFAEHLRGNLELAPSASAAAVRKLPDDLVSRNFLPSDHVTWAQGGVLHEYLYWISEVAIVPSKSRPLILDLPVSLPEPSPKRFTRDDFKNL